MQTKILDILNNIPHHMNFVENRKAMFGWDYEIWIVDNL